MLISFLSLVALAQRRCSATRAGRGSTALSLETILGYAFTPLALVMGVPWKDAVVIGDLLGTRMVLNELIAYSQLGTDARRRLDPRTFTIATYALCGFANFSSIGIQIGGIGALGPERRDDLARLGLRALLAGHLRQLHDRLHRGGAPVSLLAGAGRGRPPRPGAARRCGPRSASSSARGSAPSPRRLDKAVTIPYGEIPHFPASTAVGHKGELVIGTLRRAFRWR